MISINTLLATTTTDEDGYYLIRHEHRGSPADYRVKLYRGNGTLYQSQTARLRANGYYIGNFGVGADYLQLTGGPVNAGGIVSLLTEDSLAQAVDQAFVHWQSQGVPAEQLQSVRSQVDVRIVDLTGSLLGQAIEEHHRIEIDLDAAGYGWGQVDLLSVVVHELGHLLGFDHDVMGEFLAVGQRFLPTLRDHDAHDHTLVTEDPAPVADGSVVARLLDTMSDAAPDVVVAQLPSQAGSLRAADVRFGPVSAPALGQQLPRALRHQVRDSVFANPLDATLVDDLVLGLVGQTT